MDQPTFDTEEEFWIWWDKAVADKANYAFPMAILKRAKLSIDTHLDKRVYLLNGEQAKIIETARELAYFNPPFNPPAS